MLDWHKELISTSSHKVPCAFSGLTQFSPENPHEVEAAMEVRNQYAWSHITTSTLDLSFKYVFLPQVNKVKKLRNTIGMREGVPPRVRRKIKYAINIEVFS